MSDILRIDKNIQLVEILSDDMADTLQKVVYFLKEENTDDGAKRPNSFYFISMTLEHQFELGWLASVYMGKPQ